MNYSLIEILIRLRYKLLWARVRSRNTKIVLFFAAYLFLAILAALFSLGGIGAGMQAIRSGKGEMEAGLALACIFLEALLASVVLGFGMSAIFSETELRRFPLTARERRFARHFIGIADPFWYLFLAMDIGVAVGLYIFGNGSFGAGLLAALALLLCNYLCARILGVSVDRLMRRKAGSAALILLGVSCACMLPLLVELKQTPSTAGLLEQAWRCLPPAAASAAMSRADMAAVPGLAVVFIWIAILALLLTALERRPAKIEAAQSAAIVWNGPIDRFGNHFGALFGQRNGMLIAHWLRFYSRNNRFRAIYPLALPAFAFLVYLFDRMASKHPFSLTLSVFLILGCLTTGQFSVNQFGYTGNGFRRYLLLPIDAAAVFRTGSYLFTALGAALIPLGAAIWCFVSRTPFSWRALVLLTASSVTGVFLFNGAAIWASLLGARRGNYYQSFGNDLSGMGNATGMGTSLAMILVPGMLAKAWPAVVSPEYWWIAPPIASAAALIYFASLRSATAVFRKRREPLMAMLEGRD